MFDQHEDNWAYESLYASMACVETRPSARTPRELLYGDDDEDCCDAAALPEAVGAGMSERALSEYRLPKCDPSLEGWSEMSVVTNVVLKKRKKPESKPQSQLKKCLNEKHRREQENVYLEELAELISASLSDMNSLSVKPDKCAILQETVNQIRRIKQQEQAAVAAGGGCGSLGELQQSEVSSSKPTILGSDVLGPLLLEALDGFLFVVNTEGRIEFVSENVASFLQYGQGELDGTSIYNILHHGDHGRFSSNLLPMSLGANGLGWAEAGGKSRTFQCRFLLRPPDAEEKQTRVSLYENMHISAIFLPYPNGAAAASSAAQGDDSSSARAGRPSGVGGVPADPEGDPPVELRDHGRVRGVCVCAIRGYAGSRPAQSRLRADGPAHRLATVEWRSEPPHLQPLLGHLARLQRGAQPRHRAGHAGQEQRPGVRLPAGLRHRPAPVSALAPRTRRQAGDPGGRPRGQGLPAGVQRQALRVRHRLGHEERSAPPEQRPGRAPAHDVQARQAVDGTPGRALRNGQPPLRQVRLRLADGERHVVHGAAGPPPGLVPLPGGPAGGLRARGAGQRLGAALRRGAALARGRPARRREAAAAGAGHSSLDAPSPGARHAAAQPAAVGDVLLVRRQDRAHRAADRARACAQLGVPPRRRVEQPPGRPAHASPLRGRPAGPALPPARDPVRPRAFGALHGRRLLVAAHRAAAAEAAQDAAALHMPREGADRVGRRVPCALGVPAPAGRGPVVVGQRPGARARGGSGPAGHQRPLRPASADHHARRAGLG